MNKNNSKMCYHLSPERSVIICKPRAWLRSFLIVLSATALTVTAACAAGELHADSIRLSGSIDNHYQIAMEVQRSGKTLSGSYSYTAFGSPLKLRGNVDADGQVSLEEFDAKGTKTGRFSGRFIADKRIVGTWTKASSKADKPLPFIAAVDKPGALDNGKDGIIVCERIKKITKPAGSPTTSVTISYPVIDAKLGENEPAAKRLEQALSPINIYGESIEQMIQENHQGQSWLAQTEYTVDYNNNYLLDADFTVSGEGAYPSSSTRHILLDTRTGTTITAADAFDHESLGKLRSLIKKRMTDEVAKVIREHQKSGDDSQSLKELFNAGTNSGDPAEHFSVSDTGVTFLHNWAFPHVALAWQPEGRYFFSFQTLKPFIRKGGPLESLVGNQ